MERQRVRAASASRSRPGLIGLLALALLGRVALSASWTSAPSPKEGEAYGWARSDVDPSRMVVSRKGRLAYSTDWGRTWAYSALEWSVDESFGPRRPIFQPGNPHVVHVAASTDQYLRSTDGGASFVRHRGSSFGHVVDVLSDSVFRDRIYLVSSFEGVFRSTDEGSTWYKLLSGRTRAMVARGPELLVSLDGYPAQLARSSDGGVTWQLSWRWDEGTMQSFAFHPNDPAEIWATDGSPRRSTDGGRSFELERSGKPHGTLLDLTSQSSGLVAGSMFGLSRWDWAQEEWSRSDAPPVFVNTLDPDPITQAVVASTHAGLLSSVDGGFSWSPLTTGLPAPVASIGGGGDRPIIASTSTSFFSEALPPEPYPWTTARGCMVGGQVVDAGAALLLGSGCGLFRSTDAGVSWVDASPQPPAGVRILWQDPVCGERLLSYVGYSVYLSTNAGETWVEIRTEGPDALAAEPCGGTLYYAYGGALGRSTDGGLSWSFNRHLQDLREISVDPWTPGRVLCIGIKLYESVDGGATLQEIEPLPPLYSSDLKFDPVDSRILYVASDEGPFRSVDNGVSWRRLSDGFRERQRATRLHLVRESTGGALLYVGTDSDGILKLSLPPKTADVNADGRVDDDDARAIESAAFGAGPPASPAFDTDGDGSVRPQDVLYLSAHLAGGPPPVESVVGTRPEYPRWTKRDVVSLGSVSATPGAVVDIPVRVRDASGTPLGVHTPSEYTVAPIRSFSLDVEASPPTSVAHVSFEKGGVLSTLAPRWESNVTGASEAHWLAAFPESAPIAWTSAPLGDLVGTVRVALAAGAPSGTSVQVRLVPERTCLLNSTGTFAEGCGDEALTIVDGRIGVGTWFGDANRDGVVDVFDVVLTMAYIVGNAPAGTPPLTAEASALDVNPLASPGVDVQDALLIMGYVVGNVPSLPQ